MSMRWWICNGKVPSLIMNSRHLRAAIWEGSLGCWHLFV